MSDICAINYTDKANYDGDGVDKSMIIMIMMIIDSDFVVAVIDPANTGLLIK